MTICLASHQTDGKGRLGRLWEDDSTQILMSILLKENLASSTINHFPLYVAQLIHQTLLPYLPNLLIKWPNDLTVNDKKVCGILTEGVYESSLQAIIIGIGINVNTEHFPPHLVDTATSLYLETQKSFDTNELVNSLIKIIESSLLHMPSHWEETIAYCNQYSSLADRSIYYSKDGQRYLANVLKIANDGALVVESNQRFLHLYSGEVTLK